MVDMDAAVSAMFGDDNGDGNDSEDATNSSDDASDSDYVPEIADSDYAIS